MKKGLILILAFTLLFSILSFIVSAQPPFQTTAGSSTKGFNIQIPTTTENHQVGTPYTFHVQVTNISNGVIITNSTASCDFHFINSSGDHLFKQEMYFDEPLDFEIFIDAGNFTLGCFDVDIYCNDSNILAGEIVSGFCTTQTGNSLEISESVLYITILFFTFLLFVFFLYLAITTPYKNEISPNGNFVTEVTKSKYAKLLCIWFTYGFFMWFLQTLNFISVSFIKAATLTNFITNILIYVGSMSVGITFLILIWMFVAIWKDILYNKQIRDLGKAFISGRPGRV